MMICDKKTAGQTCWGGYRIAFRTDKGGDPEKIYCCEGHALTAYTEPSAPRKAILRLMDAVRESESVLCAHSNGRYEAKNDHAELIAARDEVYRLLGIITEKGVELADPLESEY